MSSAQRYGNSNIIYILSRPPSFRTLACALHDNYFRIGFTMKISFSPQKNARFYRICIWTFSKTLMTHPAIVRERKIGGSSDPLTGNAFSCAVYVFVPKQKSVSHFDYNLESRGSYWKPFQQQLQRRNNYITIIGAVQNARAPVTRKTPKMKNTMNKTKTKN